MGEMAMKPRSTLSLGMVGSAALAAIMAFGGLIDHAEPHGAPHTPQQLKAFGEVFMEQVRKGDLLFHGDAATQQQMGVTLSTTGMACAMCHPMASDTHPHQFPKFQEQMSKFATLRDMINWCIEKPNQGEKIDSDSEAMQALEAYISWSNSGSVLTPGVH
jgi:thiosulfate dehydrogenase